jgi:hypothetical protein
MACTGKWKTGYRRLDVGKGSQVATAADATEGERFALRPRTLTE